MCVYTFKISICIGYGYIVILYVLVFVWDEMHIFTKDFLLLFVLFYSNTYLHILSAGRHISTVESKNDTIVYFMFFFFDNYKGR